MQLHFNPLRYAEKLEEGGFTNSQAKAAAEALTYVFEAQAPSFTELKVQIEEGDALLLKQIACVNERLSVIALS